MLVDGFQENKVGKSIGDASDEHKRDKRNNECFVERGEKSVIFAEETCAYQQENECHYCIVYLEGGC